MVSSCLLSWPQQRPVRRRRQRRSSRSVRRHRRRNNITVHYVTVGGGAGGLIVVCSAVAADYLPTVMMAVTSRLAASAATASLHRPIMAATSSLSRRPVPSTSAREEETLRHGFFSAIAASRICATFVCFRSFYRRREVYTSGGRAGGLLSRWRRWALTVQTAPRFVAFTPRNRRVRRRSTRRLSA
jgi:hypothetical protein